MAAKVFQLPLVATPQRFRLSLGGRAFVVVCRYLVPEDEWYIDLLDEATGAPVVLFLPLVTGADLFGQLRHLNLGGSLVVVSDGDGDAVPNLTTLGVTANAFYITGAA